MTMKIKKSNPVKTFFNRNADLLAKIAITAVILATLCGGVLYVGSSITTYGVSNSASEARLTHEQESILADPAVKSFVDDEAFTSDVWRDFTVINGWSKERADLNARLQNLADDVYFPGLSNDAQRMVDTTHGARLWKGEFPVYESVLSAANSACAEPAPAQAIEATSASERAAALMFKPLTPEQSDITSKAFTVAVGAGVKHLCPER